ncbi:MAG: hypothetical protein GWO04_21110, partial [Actinobacteria bacterium]|nr:hypothetical protein [Actinomycetota bacterium]
HEARVVLNQGTPAEVRSDEAELPIAQAIVSRVGASDGFLKDGEQGVFVSQEVDVLN